MTHAVSSAKDAKRTFEVPVSALVEQVGADLRAGRAVTFVIRGRSMRPALEDKRDSVRLVPPRAEKVRRGDVVLAATREGAYVLHRVIAREGDQLTLKGDGNVRGCEHCAARDVIGVAECFYRRRSRRPLPVRSLRWRIYSALWMLLDPVRRYLLFLHRRLWLPVFG